MRIIAATGNAHKIEEIGKITARFGFELVSMREAGVFTEPEENGQTFEENSFIRRTRSLSSAARLLSRTTAGSAWTLWTGLPGSIQPDSQAKAATRRTTAERLWR